MKICSIERKYCQVKEKVNEKKKEYENGNNPLKGERVVSLNDGNRCIYVKQKKKNCTRYSLTLNLFQANYSITETLYSHFTHLMKPSTRQLQLKKLIDSTDWLTYWLNVDMFTTN